jgi:hypothetical protein
VGYVWIDSESSIDCKIVSRISHSILTSFLEGIPTCNRFAVYLSIDLTMSYIPCVRDILWFFSFLFLYFFFLSFNCATEAQKGLSAKRKESRITDQGIKESRNQGIKESRNQGIKEPQY